MDGCVTFDRLILLPNEPGIYYVVAKGKVVYVGESKSIYNRWNRDGLFAHHKKAIVQEIDKQYPVRICYNFCPLEYLRDKEAEAIEKFKPPLNKQFPRLA
ncbi:MAG: GIY-YIG nuclease family protein [Microcoleus sp.]